jgi:multiple sugar transport system permease protein
MIAVSGKRERARTPFGEWVHNKVLPEGGASVGRYVSFILVIILAIVSLFPLYWALITSFKARGDIATIPPSFAPPFPPSIQNYIDLLKGAGVADAPVLKWLMNSVLVTVTGTIGVLVVTSLAGYSFARKQFPFRDLIFWLLIGTILIPGWSTIIALYAWTLKLGMHDTYWALILPGLASPFAVFLFRQFAVTLPDELFQSARMDGASEIQLWWHIAMPLCRPVLATIGIFTLVGMWNDFLWPLLVLNKPQLYTLPVGVSLLMYQVQGTGPAYGVAMSAAVLMSVLPVLAFLLMQRQMIQGLTIGALKG